MDLFSNTDSNRKIIAAISFLLFCFSLILPAIYLKAPRGDESPTLFGLLVFLYGFLGLLTLDPRVIFPWLTNFIYFSALVFFINGKIKTTVYLSIAIFLLSLSSFNVLIPPQPRVLLDSIHGDLPIKGFHIGAFFWFLSLYFLGFFSLLYANIFTKRRNIS